MLTPFRIIASFLYSLCYKIDCSVRSKKSKILPKPVFSVGNLTVGGTGKTPLTIRLAQDLMGLSLSPAILSRGYKGFLKGSSGPLIVTSEDHQQKNVSEEIHLMAKKLKKVPIGCGPERFGVAESLLKESQLDCFILEDGFQHWPIHRDLDIVCVDATDPWGSGHLIPWGKLREPRSALARAQTIVLTRTELASEESLHRLEETLKDLSPGAIILKSHFRFQLEDPDGNKMNLYQILNKANVMAVSGIGNPMAFEKNLEQQGAQVFPLRFSDHHNYSEKDKEHIVNVALKHRAIIVTTEKDWEKLRPLWRKSKNESVSFFIMHTDLHFDEEGEEKWFNMIKIYGKN